MILRINCKLDTYLLQDYNIVCELHFPMHCYRSLPGTLWAAKCPREYLLKTGGVQRSVPRGVSGAPSSSSGRAVSNNDEDNK